LQFLVFCIGLAIAIPIALLLLWRRAPKSSRWAIPVFLVGVLLAQATAVSAVAVSVNRDYGFYPTWASLWGTPTAPPVVVAGARLGLGAVVGTRRRLLPLTSGSASDIGRYERTILKGAQSGISSTVITWLPPQYHDRRYAKTRFPVVMVLGGADVRISTVVDRLNFATTASQEIRTGRVAPFVAVFPEINVALPVETECTNYPGGPVAHLAQPGCSELGHLHAAHHQGRPTLERDGLVHRRLLRRVAPSARTHPVRRGCFDRGLLHPRARRGHR